MVSTKGFSFKLCWSLQKSGREIWCKAHPCHCSWVYKHVAVATRSTNHQKIQTLFSGFWPGGKTDMLINLWGRVLLNCFLAPEDMQVGQGLLKHEIPWFFGVGVWYWTECNSTHGPSWVLGKSLECPCGGHSIHYVVLLLKNRIKLKGNCSQHSHVTNYMDCMKLSRNLIAKQSPFLIKPTNHSLSFSLTCNHLSAMTVSWYHYGNDHMTESLLINSNTSS